jgi:mRNA interferase RelE/StbE
VLYQILIERSVVKYLKRILETDYYLIKIKIQSLANDPRPNGSIKLKGRNAYRIRQGDYRIIYEIRDKALVIIVVTVGHRREIYRIK